MYGLGFMLANTICGFLISFMGSGLRGLNTCQIRLHHAPQDPILSIKAPIFAEGWGDQVSVGLEM